MNELPRDDRAGRPFEPVFPVDYPPPSLEWIALFDLHVDDAYQRRINEAHLAQLRGAWADAHPVLFVSLRADGRYFILNGNHRRKFLLEKGRRGVICIVYRSLSPTREAALFDYLNAGQLAITPEHLWHVRVVAEEALTTAMDEILTRYGLHVGRRIHADDEPDLVGCPMTLRRICSPRGTDESPNPAALEDVVSFVTAAWPGNAAAVHADVLRAVAGFLSRFGDKIERAEAIERASRLPIRDVLADAREDAAKDKQKRVKATGRLLTVAERIAQRIQEEYDRNRRQTTRLLPDADYRR